MIKIRHRDKLYKKIERKRKQARAEELKAWEDWWSVSFTILYSEGKGSV